MLDDGGLSGGRPRLWDGTRPLKRWRYVGVFSEELAVCAALVAIGPLRQSFWALHMRGERVQRERTRLLPRRGELRLTGGPGAAAGEPARLAVHDRGVALELELHEGGAIEALCPHGRSRVWTRKQAGVAATGTLRIDGGRARSIEARAVIDDTAGYHARETEWWWSAGVGEGPDGTALAWNLVSGVNDPATGSERAVWVDGRPRETAPVEFAADLTRVEAADGSRLSFTAESERARREELLIVASDYRAPFGTFAGELPGAIALARGFGVMEHHRARW